MSYYLPRCNAMVVNNLASSHQTNALALLNTARLLLEQRSSKNIADRSAFQPRKNRRNLVKPVASDTVSRTKNASWETLFDGNTEIDFERQDAFISSRVQAHLPSVKSLRKSLGSEIPDMELHLQMEAAKVRAMVNGYDTAALAFMDLHHKKTCAKTLSSYNGDTPLSTMEKVAMSSMPSQLPELATTVLSREEPNTAAVRPNTVVDKSILGQKKKEVPNDGKNTIKVIPIKPVVKLSAQMKNASKSRDKVKRIESKHVSTIMSTRKTFQNSADFGKKTAKMEGNARVSHDEEIQLARVIQRGVELHSIKSKFEESHGRDITRQEWTQLAKLDGTKQLRRMVSDYRKAKSKLVMANMGLVHAVVRARLGVTGSSAKVTTTDRNGISYEELVQEGSLGLLRAAELFDPSRGLRFSTYATIWIKGTLGNSNMSETITLPLREKNKWNKIQTAISDLQLENGAKDGSYQPTYDEIAVKNGMGVEEVRNVMSKMIRAKNVLSLDYQYNTQTRSGGANNSFEALQNDKNLMDDVDLVERLHVRADVIAALARNLDPREARLMRLRYGLNDGRTRSIKDCAEAMGISQSRAQQLATGCLEKLRQAHDAQSLQEYLLSVA